MRGAVLSWAFHRRIDEERVTPAAARTRRVRSALQSGRGPDPERQFAKRWTYYIDPTGKIAFIDKAVKPATSGQDIVAKLGELNVPKRK